VALEREKRAGLGKDVGGDVEGGFSVMGGREKGQNDPLNCSMMETVGT
jgi:hypothetical protein